MIKLKKSKSGCSFHGDEIATTVSLLKNILGEPQYNKNNGEGKVNYMWDCFTYDNVFFTIYDYKIYRPIGDFELIKFHIGAATEEDSKHAKKCLSAVFASYGG